MEHSSSDYQELEMRKTERAGKPLRFSRKVGKLGAWCPNACARRLASEDR